MPRLPIISVPNPRLRLVSTRVQLVDKNSTQFLNDLGETLVKKDDPPGVGLSAIQVDQPLRAFVTYLPPDPHNPNPPENPKELELITFINPEIIDHSSSLTLGPNKKHPILEGCLSIPNVYGPVWRWDWVDITFDTLNSFENQNPKSSAVPSRIKTRFSGFPARVIQHEYDHLDGILFTDYILGRSPASAFKPQKTGGPLYFDSGRELVEVEDPSALANW